MKVIFNKYITNFVNPRVMTKHIPILLFLLSFNFCFAQQDSLKTQGVSSGRLTNIIDIQDLATEGFNYWQDKFRGHWAGVHLGLNGFANSDYSMYDENEIDFLDIKLERSTLLDLNLIQFSTGLQRNRNTIGLITGIGMQIQTFHLNQNTSIDKSGYRIEPFELFYDSNQKSKLSSTYLTIPLLIEFQVSIRQYANRFYFATGILAQKRLSTHTKIKYRSNKKKEKLKTPDDFYMHDFRFSMMARMGYRWINLFASYDIRPLFIKNKGPEVYPFSFGVTLISFK